MVDRMLLICSFSPKLCYETERAQGQPWRIF